ncbi:MAG TPA: nucleotidyltransferase family protein [Bacteroidia bacterium]|jgi:hypothetical protein|nr:nucleotidyltransferase family protein [Bacteroidia bacterium]
MNRFNILGQLCRVDLQGAQLDEVKQYFASISTDLPAQEELFSYCLKWKLAPWVYTQLMRNELDRFLKPGVLEKFRAAHDKVEQQNRERNEEASKFLAAFAEENIDVVILKGNLFAKTFYHDPGYKRMNDFDILIRKEDWGKAQEVYRKLECIPMGFGWSGEKDKPTKFSHTSIPYISRNFKCIIGTQWGLKSPTTSYRVNMDELWKTTESFDFNGIAAKKLSPEFNLLHLILHMGIYKCGIRDCMDVYNLIIAEKIDEDKMVRIIRESKAEDKAVFTLRMCEACIGKLPGTLLEKLHAKKYSFIGKRLRSRMKMISETGDLHLSYNDYFQDIEKNVLYFNIVLKFHQKLYFYGKILRLIYFPGSEMTLRFIDKPHRDTFFNRVRGRIAGPWFSFSMIAQEIGWPVTMLLFLKLFIDLLISPVNYFTGRESYFAYLKRIGIDPELMKKTVANVQ